MVAREIGHEQEQRLAGRIPLKEAAQRAGTSPAHARRLAKQGKVSGAVKAGGVYYVPEDAEIPVKRRTVTPELEERVRRMLRESLKGQLVPAKAVARQLGLSETTVRKIRRKLEADELELTRELRREREEWEAALERIKSTPELTGLILPRTVLIKRVEDEDETELLSLPALRGRVDIRNGTIYVSGASLEEIAAHLQDEDGT